MVKYAYACLFTFPLCTQLIKCAQAHYLHQNNPCVCSLANQFLSIIVVQTSTFAFCYKIVMRSSSSVSRHLSVPDNHYFGILHKESIIWLAIFFTIIDSVVQHINLSIPCHFTINCGQSSIHLSFGHISFHRQSVLWWCFQNRNIPYSLTAYSKFLELVLQKGKQHFMLLL